MTVDSQVIEDDFRKALAEHGIFTKDEFIFDGSIHRFHVDGDRRGDKNAWYVVYLDDRPAGSFGCHKRGITQKWRLRGSEPLGPADREAIAKRNAKSQAKREAVHAAARELAKKIYDATRPAEPEHPYLKCKSILPYKMRLIGREKLQKIAPHLKIYSKSDLLVIPVRNTKGELQSLQFITGRGDKIFLAGGLTMGGYFSIGSLTDIIVVSEGIATAASIHEATGYAVVVALYAGNLKPVAEALRVKYPNHKILIAGDNDN